MRGAAVLTASAHKSHESYTHLVQCHIHNSASPQPLLCNCFSRKIKEALAGFIGEIYSIIKNCRGAILHFETKGFAKHLSI